MEAVENIAMEALQEQVRALQASLATLNARLDQMESAAKPTPPPPPPPVDLPAPIPEPAPVVEEGISEEILMVLSAAIAAYLGKRVRIRQARLMPQTGASAWAQQGRVFIQASHMLRH